MTKEDLIKSMVILMAEYATREEVADAIFRLWGIHTELEIRDGIIVNKVTGERFK